MRTFPSGPLVAALGLSLLLAGCGQKGPLYLPTKPQASTPASEQKPLVNPPASTPTPEQTPSRP